MIRNGMNKRDYLRSLGFQVGERGRFNSAMKIALAKYEGVFDEDQPKLKLNKLKTFKPAKNAIVVPGQRKLREARMITGYTKEGYKVGFDGCIACHQHMVYCSCPSLVPPKIVATCDDILVRIP
jgi:hypothetical protein